VPLIAKTNYVCILRTPTSPPATYIITVLLCFLTDTLLIVWHIFEDNHNWGASPLVEKDNLRDTEIKEVHKMVSCESHGFFGCQCEYCRTKKTVCFEIVASARIVVTTHVLEVSRLSCHFKLNPHQYLSFKHIRKIDSQNHHPHSPHQNIKPLTTDFTTPQ